MGQIGEFDERSWGRGRGRGWEGGGDVVVYLIYHQDASFFCVIKNKPRATQPKLAIFVKNNHFPSYIATFGWDVMGPFSITIFFKKYKKRR